MNKCSPVEMRKNLIIVDRFKNIGLDFVAVPVRDECHKNELIAMSNDVMEEMATGMEKEESRHHEDGDYSYLCGSEHCRCSN